MAHERQKENSLIMRRNRVRRRFVLSRQGSASHPASTPAGSRRRRRGAPAPATRETGIGKRRRRTRRRQTASPRPPPRSARPATTAGGAAAQTDEEAAGAAHPGERAAPPILGSGVDTGLYIAPILFDQMPQIGDEAAPVGHRAAAQFGRRRHRPGEPRGQELLAEKPADP